MPSRPLPSLLLLLALPPLAALGCRPDPSGASPGAAASASASASASSLLPVDEIPVKMARERGTYKGTAQARITALDTRIRAVEGKLSGAPAQALRDAHWEALKAFKAVEACDEATFAAARAQFEEATKKLDAKLTELGG